MLSGSESNGVIIRSCRFAPFYVAWGATTRDPNVNIPVETVTPPCQRPISTMGRGGRKVNRLQGLDRSRVSGERVVQVVVR